MLVVQTVPLVGKVKLVGPEVVKNILLLAVPTATIALVAAAKFGKVNVWLPTVGDVTLSVEV